MKHRAFDVFGNIAVVNFQSHPPTQRKITLKDKKKFASSLLKENKSVRTVLEKTGRIKGRLRKPTTKHIAGEKTKEVLYRENDCVFRFNIDTTYFSPRLSNERKEIASKIKKGEDVLVMFAGVSPYSIVIARNSKANRVYSNEINRIANKYAKLNVELNKVKDRVEIVQGDIKKVVGKILTPPSRPKLPARLHSQIDKNLVNKIIAKKSIIKFPKKFDVIVMPRPQLKDSFLKESFSLSKKGTRVFYYDFCKASEEEKIVEKIKDEAKKNKKKVKILNVKKAGEIAPYKIRIRVDFVLN